MRHSFMALLVLLACNPSVADRARQHQALLDAAGRGDLNAVKVLISKGADVNANAKTGETPLMVAATCGHGEVVRYLASKGADPNVKTGPGGLTPLIAAATNGDVDTLRALISKGADVRYRTAGGWSALASAACSDQPHAVRLLLKAGAPVSFLEAVTLGDTARAKKLLAGKDLNAVYAGSTLLVLAADKGHTEIVRWLLDNGARIDERPKDWSTSALLVAANGDRTETVHLLLERGASLKVRDAFLRTPLIMASDHGNAEMVRMLLKHGADTSSRDTHKKTALWYATHRGHSAVIELLKAAGGTE